MSGGQSIASILIYPEATPYTKEVSLTENAHVPKGKGVLGIIGAGNFTQMTVLPKMKNNPLQLHSIASAGGVNGTAMAKKYGISKSTTDYKTILEDPAVDIVMITTRHNLHAPMTLAALQAGKHVFVEKPLALHAQELDDIIAAQKESGMSVTVGYNRRFSPHIQKIKLLVGDAPMLVIATMNAGFIPPNVWVHDMEIGGGRIIGEACHYMDLIIYLTGSLIQTVTMQALGTQPATHTDNASILLKMENGSTGVINYFSNGHKAYSKERVEVYAQERVLIMDNFIKTEGYGFKDFSKLKTKQDKGHAAQFELLGKRITAGGAPLIPFDQIVNSTKASFAAIESMVQGGLPIKLI